MKHPSHSNLTQAPLFAYRLDEVIAAVLTDSPQTVEQIAAQVNAFVVETSSALCLMVMEGRARIGMGFTYTKPQDATTKAHRKSRLSDDGETVTLSAAGHEPVTVTVKQFSDLANGKGRRR